MLLAIDIGNSNIAFGVFRGKRLIYKKTASTETLLLSGGCEAVARSIPYKNRIADIIISSVVPKALSRFEKALKARFKKKILVLGKNIEAPLVNHYNEPEQVGQDRLANSVAAESFLGKGNKKFVIVIDFGTAVTFDVIKTPGEYLGGLIFPGIRLSLENLSRRAALLPRVTIKKPRSLIGGDTKESMRSGLLNGYGSLCDGIIERLLSLCGKNTEIIATGGDAPLVAEYSNIIKRIDLGLTLKGLRITYEKRYINNI